MKLILFLSITIQVLRVLKVVLGAELADRKILTINKFIIKEINQSIVFLLIYFLMAKFSLENVHKMNLNCQLRQTNFFQILYETFVKFCSMTKSKFNQSKFDFILESVICNLFLNYVYLSFFK